MYHASTPAPPTERRPGRHRGGSAAANVHPLFRTSAGRHRAEAPSSSRRTRSLTATAVTATLMAAPALTMPAAADSYTVRSGDTLGEIAQRQDTTWRALYRLNRDRISSPSQIYVGQELELSRHGRRHRDRRVSPGEVGDVGTYTVQAGDTLSAIARRAGTSWRQLYQVNRDVLSDPRRIYVGQVLRLRGEADQRTTDSHAFQNDAPAEGGSFVQRLLDEARALEGISYNYGGNSPREGFDCSGFTSYVFERAGRTIPRTSRAQAAAADRISRSQLRAGDLIFFTPYGEVSHVAIYAGDGMVWEAPSSGQQVRLAPIWDVPRFYGRL